jgi:hypothetical protein
MAAMKGSFMQEFAYSELYYGESEAFSPHAAPAIGLFVGGILTPTITALYALPPSHPFFLSLSEVANYYYATMILGFSVSGGLLSALVMHGLLNYENQRPVNDPLQNQDRPALRYYHTFMPWRAIFDKALMPAAISLMTATPLLIKQVPNSDSSLTVMISMVCALGIAASTTGSMQFSKFVIRLYDSWRAGDAGLMPEQLSPAELVRPIIMLAVITALAAAAPILSIYFSQQAYTSASSIVMAIVAATAIGLVFGGLNASLRYPRESMAVLKDWQNQILSLKAACQNGLQRYQQPTWLTSASLSQPRLVATQYGAIETSANPSPRKNRMASLGFDRASLTPLLAQPMQPV